MFHFKARQKETLIPRKRCIKKKFTHHSIKEINICGGVEIVEIFKLRKALANAINQRFFKIQTKLILDIFVNPGGEDIFFIAA